MNKWLLLIVVIGLGVLGWMDRDKIRLMIISKGYGKYLPGNMAPGTPNPASDAVRRAKMAYPALGIPNSALNQRFVALYNDKKDRDPDFLVKDDWPMLLAQQAAADLGGGLMPSPGGAPSQPENPSTFQPGTLDNRPGQGLMRPKATAPPMVQLPGLSGTSLDQPATGTKH